MIRKEAEASRGRGYASPGLAPEGALEVEWLFIVVRVGQNGWWEVAPGQARAVTDLYLHLRTSQEVPEPTHLVAGFRLHESTTQPPPQMTHPKGGLSRHQSPTKVNPVP